MPRVYVPRTSTWRICPECRSRATKQKSLVTGLYRCQQCGHTYADPNEAKEGKAMTTKAVHGPAGEVSPALTFAALREANVKRCTAPSGFNHPLGKWSPLEWSGAMMGEVGEVSDMALVLFTMRLADAGGQAANTAKKLERILGRTKGNVKNETADTLREKLAREIADVVAYADLLAASQDIDLGATLRQVFNDKSVDVGSGVRL